MRKNQFLEMWEASGHSPYVLNDLLEFLETAQITCYGLRLTPKNLARIRNDLMKYGAKIDEY